MKTLHPIPDPARLHSNCGLAHIGPTCDQAVSILIVSILQARGLLLADATASVYRRYQASIFVCMIVPIESWLGRLRYNVLGEHVFVPYDRRLAFGLLCDLGLLEVP